jgi:hypothetical protein
MLGTFYLLLGASPELQPGGFVEKPCHFQDCRVITVYWRVGILIAMTIIEM